MSYAKHINCGSIANKYVCVALDPMPLFYFSFFFADRLTLFFPPICMRTIKKTNDALTCPQSYVLWDGTYFNNKNQQITNKIHQSTLFIWYFYNDLLLVSVALVCVCGLLRALVCQHVSVHRSWPFVTQIYQSIAIGYRRQGTLLGQNRSSGVFVASETECAMMRYRDFWAGSLSHRSALISCIPFNQDIISKPLKWKNIANLISSSYQTVRSFIINIM